MNTIIINSKEDIQKWVENELSHVNGQPSKLFTARPDYQALVTRITDGLDKHASEDGYQYGQDWAEFFDGITIGGLVPDLATTSESA